MDRQVTVALALMRMVLALLDRADRPPAAVWMQTAVNEVDEVLRRRAEGRGWALAGTAIAYRLLWDDSKGLCSADGYPGRER